MSPEQIRYWHDRRAHDGANARELAALLERQAQYEAHETERAADEEADAPTPIADLRYGQRLVHDEVQQRRERDARVDAEEHDADRESRALRRRFDDVRD